MQEPKMLLREVNARLEFAKLLARRGLLDLAEDLHDHAQAALDETQAIAHDLNVGPDSELAKNIETLHQAIASAS